MKFKRWFAALLSIWLLCPLLCTARAHEVPDPSKKGSITVKMEYKGKPVKGGTLSAYYVGQIQENDGNYSFVKTPDTASFTGSYANISDPKLAQSLAAFVKEKKLSPSGKAANKDGKAVFSQLTPGLYLIVQSVTSKGFDPINPFLVSVPFNQDGHYVYDVTADGKFQIHQAPKPTQPPKPTPSKLPQTGQLNWPVPAMAVVGLLLFSAGWLLRFGKGKDPYES